MQWGMLAWVLGVCGIGLVEFVATGGYPGSWVDGWGVEAYGVVSMCLLLFEQ